MLPWLRSLSIFGGAFFLLIAIGIGFELGVQFANFSNQRLISENSQLHLELAHVKQTNEALNNQNVMLNQTSKIDKAAMAQARTDVSLYQQDIISLKEENTFYKVLVSPEEAKVGLHIQKLRIDSKGKDRLYQFRLVVTQTNKEAINAAGKLSMSVEGMLDGKSQRLTLQSLVTESRFSWQYSFRYFQNFEVEFRLPEHFEPKSVWVQLQPDGRNSVGVERNFLWATENAGN